MTFDIIYIFFDNLSFNCSSISALDPTCLGSILGRLIQRIQVFGSYCTCLSARVCFKLDDEALNQAGTMPLFWLMIAPRSQAYALRVVHMRKRWHPFIICDICYFCHRRFVEHEQNTTTKKYDETQYVEFSKTTTRREPMTAHAFFGSEADWSVQCGEQVQTGYSGWCDKRLSIDK